MWALLQKEGSVSVYATSKGSFRLGHPTSCATQAGPSPAQRFSDLHRQHNSPAGFIPVQVAGPSDSKYVRLALCWLNFKGKCTNVTHSLIRRRGSEAQVFAFPTISRGCWCAWPGGHNLGTVGLKHKTPQHTVELHDWCFLVWNIEGMLYKTKTNTPQNKV